MKKTTIEKCASCGKEIVKLTTEINRQKKKGRTLFYCNLKCAGKNKKNIKHISQFHDNFKLTRYIRQPDDYTKFRWYIKSIIKNSKKRSHTYDVDIEYLKELWESQNGICPFTGIKLILRTHNYKQERSPYQASLDRIDNSKGYIKGNIRFVSLMFNYAKNDFTDEQVIEFCNLVTNKGQFMEPEWNHGENEDDATMLGLRENLDTLDNNQQAS